MPFDYDLFVIGAGSGGLAAAERAAAYGARVAIAEQANTGGACVNYGCIPEKFLDYAASFRQLNQIAVSYGWDTADRNFDWRQFITEKDQQIQRLNQVHRRNLKDAGVEFFQGHTAFVDAHTLTVANRSITAEKILIAVGAHPVKPKIPGIEHTITWRELYHLPQQPQQMAIVGCDPIGAKIAGSLTALGSQVTQIVAEDQILSGLDAEIAQIIQRQLVKRGVKLLTQTEVEKIEKCGDRFHVKLSGSCNDALTVDTVLVDAGRKPNLTDLNLAQAGVQLTESGMIQVNATSRTTQANIFAVGDCTGRIPLTPSAIAQARAFADTEFAHATRTANLEWIPISISSHPEAATVGFSEAKAREQFGDAIHCYYTQFRPLLYCLAQLEEKSLVKMVVNRQDSERVLGVHMVGEGAVEIIQSLAPALRLGATKQDLDATIGIHPSSAEEIFSM